MALQVGEHRIRVDKEGYLQNLDDWSRDVAAAIAESEGIDLTDAHWEVIRAVRHFFRQYDYAPAMRPLVKFIGRELGPDKGKSLYLLQLFPDSPAKLVSKIAGLPRPDNCL